MKKSTAGSFVGKVYQGLGLIVLFFTISIVTAQNMDILGELIHYPDFIFYNGQVLTADADVDFTIAEAVAVRGNRILAVGASQQIQLMAGPDTRSVDLKGNSLTPGFIYSNADNSVPAGDIQKDSMWAGRIQPELGGDNMDQILSTLTHIVDQEGGSQAPVYFNLVDTWSGTVADSWDITTLDEVAGDTPVIVFLESSEAVVNTAMLNLAVKEGFPPDHLHLQKDANGKYTGRVGAQAAGYIGREVRPWPDPVWFDEVAIPGAISSLTNYAHYGVTVATGHMSALTMTVMNRIFHEQPDKLVIRVFPGLDFLDKNWEGEKYLKRMGNLVDFALTDERGPMVTIVATSVGPHAGTPDGVSGLLSIKPRTNIIRGLSKNPRGDNRWTAEWITGLDQSEVTPEQLRQTDYHNVLLARKHGWPVTGIHNMGSEGIRLAMQVVYEAEQQEQLYVKKLWRTHGLDHNIEWEPEIFAYYDAHPELKGIVSFGIGLKEVVDQRSSKPLGIDKLLDEQWGVAGLEKIAPLRTIMERGIQFHIEGSEPHEDTQHPTWHMQKAVTRIDRDGRVIAINQAIDRKSAFLALTRWAARFINEKQMGTIEPGKFADLVVFNGNILDVPIEDLANVKAVMTMVGGQVAYETVQ